MDAMVQIDNDIGMLVLMRIAVNAVGAAVICYIKNMTGDQYVEMSQMWQRI